jgi:hypothetical protein
MHLRKSDDAIRSGLSMNIDTKSDVKDELLSDDAQTDFDTSSHDVIEIHLGEQSSEELLDTLLASWTLLLQRYQRDAFHKFTWGPADSSRDLVECIETECLELLKLETANELLTTVRNVVSKEVLGLESPLMLFFNDGTADEVSSK